MNSPISTWILQSLLSIGCQSTVPDTHIVCLQHLVSTIQSTVLHRAPVPSTPALYPTPLPPHHRARKGQRKLEQDQGLQSQLDLGPNLDLSISKGCNFELHIFQLFCKMGLKIELVSLGCWGMSLSQRSVSDDATHQMPDESQQWKDPEHQCTLAYQVRTCTMFE